MRRRRIGKYLLFALLLALGLGLCACGSGDGRLAEQLAGKTFVREKGGFGSDFTISLMEDGSCEFYEGALSSVIGVGFWTVEDGVLTLSDTDGYQAAYRFAVKNGALVFLAEESGRFVYLTVEDGDRFLPRD